MKYEIQDWAGNTLTALGVFQTFEEAWDVIMTRFPEEDWEDLFVCEREGMQNDRR
jgi:hypothetical protein